MKLRGRQGGQLMLIILGTLLFGSGVATGVFVSGKSIKSMRKDVAALHLDAGRQERVFLLLEEWEEIAAPAREDLRDYAHALADLVVRHDSSEAEFRAVLERQRTKLGIAEDRLLPLREQLRATLAQEEWDRLFD